MIFKVNKLMCLNAMSLTVNNKVLECLVDFILLYLSASPSLDELSHYISERFKEKDIIYGYNAGIVTQEEVCSFIFSNLYTKFVLNKENIQNVSERDLAEIQWRLKGVLFS